MKNIYELIKMLNKKYEELKLIEEIEYVNEIALKLLLSDKIADEDLFMMSFVNNKEKVFETKIDTLNFIKQNGLDNIKIGYSYSYVDKYILNGLINYINDEDIFNDEEKKLILLQLKKYYMENDDEFSEDEEDEFEYDEFESEESDEEEFENYDFVEYLKELDNEEICIEFDNNDSLKKELIENYISRKDEYLYLDEAQINIDKNNFSAEDRFKKMIIDMFNKVINMLLEKNQGVFAISSFLNNELLINKPFINKYLYENENTDEMKDKIKLLLMNDYAYNVINNKQMNPKSILYLNIFNKLSNDELYYLFYSNQEFCNDIVSSFIDNNINFELSDEKIHKKANN